ncbi:MAG TPA: hypothetical protein VMD59_24265 [Acidimicrobiales bacterium]|nr:hypothetical protein [Acidimicrobiales bacterium]
MGVVLDTTVFIDLERALLDAAPRVAVAQLAKQIENVAGPGTTVAMSSISASELETIDRSIAAVRSGPKRPGATRLRCASSPGGGRSAVRRARPRIGSLEQGRADLEHLGEARPDGSLRRPEPRSRLLLAAGPIGTRRWSAPAGFLGALAPR